MKQLLLVFIGQNSAIFDMFCVARVICRYVNLCPEVKPAAKIKKQ